MNNLKESTPKILTVHAGSTTFRVVGGPELFKIAIKTAVDSDGTTSRSLLVYYFSSNPPPTLP